MKSLYPAALGLALAGSVEAAAWPPVNGDLVLGVQATGGTGSTSNVFVNLGPAFEIRENPEQGVIVNIAAELTAAFGANWFSRTDLHFGVAANRVATSGGATLNGDATRVVYVSRAASSPGASTLFTGYTSSSLGVAGNNIQSLVGAADDLSTRGKGVVTMTQAGNPTQWFNSWTTWNPTPGSAFNIFSGGIQNNFGKAGNATPYVDIQRLAPGTTTTREASVGITRRGDVVVSSNANVFTAVNGIAALQATQYYVGDTVNANIGTGLSILGGLPTGVTYNSNTGVVSGTITAAPTNTAGVVTLKQGTNTLLTVTDFAINVAQYPFLGSYEVLVQDGDSTPAGLPEGKVRFTITKPGTFSGAAVLRGSTATQTLKGSFTPTSYASQVTLTMPFQNSANQTVFTATVTLTEGSELVTGTLVADGQTNPDTLSGFRLALGPVSNRALTAAFTATGGDRTNVPAGFGFGAGALGSLGSASLAGTLGDGQKFTTAIFPSTTDQSIVYVQPYGDTTGSFFGGFINLPNLGQRNAAGAASFGLAQAGRPAAGIQWRRGANANVSNLSYDGGFGLTTPVAVSTEVSTFTPVGLSTKNGGNILAAQLGAKSNTFVATYANQTTTPADSSATNPDAVLDNENEALPDTWVMGASPVTFTDPSISGRFLNEVQSLIIGGPAPTTSTQFTLRLGTQTTAPITCSTNSATTASAIQNALIALSNVGAGNVSVSADSALQFRITFLGALGNQDVAALMATRVAVAGTPLTTFAVSELVKGTGNAFTSLLVDEVQRIAVPATVTTFNLSFRAVRTTNITRAATGAATATNIQTALQGLSNIGVASNIAVTSVGTDEAQAFNVTFQGGLGKTDQLALTTTIVTGTGPITVTEVGKGGSVIARVSGTATVTSGTFSASVLMTNSGIRGSVEGVFLQDDSFGTVNGKGQVRIPVATGLNQDFQTIPVTLRTN